MSGSERPHGRKAARRRLGEKANNYVIDLITTQLKELSSGRYESDIQRFCQNNKQRKNS